MRDVLIGRDAESRALNDALSDPDRAMVVVRGPSGAGKTALVGAVLAGLSCHGVIVGIGKYGEGGASGAFAPILQALGQAIDRALDLLYDPEAGLASLRGVLGAQAPLMAEAGLAIPGFVPSAEGFTDLSAAATVQIVDTIARLFAWLDGFGVDVILFVDDWQRAPSGARSFLSLVAEKRPSSRCRVVLAERKNAAVTDSADAAIIEIGPLRGAERIALLDDVLGAGAGPVVAEWLGAESEGLPFDLIEIARALHEHGAIANTAGAWRIEPSRAAAVGRADFHKVLVMRVLTLPARVQEVGTALALWGDKAQLALIAKALDETPAKIVAAAEMLERAGIVRLAGTTADFSHDRLREVLLEALPAERRKEIAAAMAERIARDRAGIAFPLVRPTLRLRLAGGLAEAEPGLWRDRFAQGAASARMTADGDIACAFAEAALALQQREPCADLDTNLSIAREALFAAAMRRDPALVRARAQTLIQSCSPQQICDAYETAIAGARQAGDLEQAWDWSMQALGRFEVRLPRVARLHHIVLAALRWRLSRALKPFRTGRQELAVDGLGRLSNIASLVGFERQSLLALLIMLSASARANALGLGDAIWAANEAVLAANFRDYRRASLLGAVALGRPSRSLKASALYRALYFGQIWTRPLAALRARCIEIYDVAVSEGDLTTAALAIRNDAVLAWRTAPDLSCLAQILAEHDGRAQRLGDAQLIGAIRQFRIFAGALRGERDMRDVDGGAAEWMAKNLPIVWMEMLAIRGDWHALAAMGEEQKTLRSTHNSHPGAIIWRFYESLARMHLGRGMRRGDMRFLHRIESLNPTDHRCKVTLLEAEDARMAGRRDTALRKYALAVRQATSLTSKFEAAIAVECAAHGVAALGDEASAARYRDCAFSIWRSWGAVSKPAPEGLPAAAPELASQLMEAQSRADVAIRSERAKSRFLAEVSHELRTPLQAMQSLLDLAAGGQSVEIDELREAFGSFRSIVDDLTDLGAMAGDAPLRPASVDLCQLVESEAALFGAAARDKGLAFSIKLDADCDALISADGHRIRQVLRNLLSNAIKYTERGGVDLTLAMRGLDIDAVTVSITVEDTGPGLREADLAKLFEPFERGGREDAAGLGLGLPLARRIAERLGGGLIAQNRDEGGARFTFSFTAARPRDAQGPAATGPARLLLVEDIALNRRLLATQLRSAGHDVVEAARGHDALTALETSAFDLVILDIGLPDIDGFEVLARIQPRVPVVLVTASTADAIRTRAEQAGVDIVLHKPISAAELEDAVARALPLSSISGSPRAFEMARLAELARREMRTSAAELTALARTGASADVAKAAHKLAGLAAQFGEAEIADAAGILEERCREGASLSFAIAALDRALSPLDERFGDAM